MFIITEDNRGDPASAEYCAQIKEQYGLSDIPVVFDPGGEAGRIKMPANHLHLVLRKGQVIGHRSRYSDETFEGAIELLLQE